MASGVGRRSPLNYHHSVLPTVVHTTAVCTRARDTPQLHKEKKKDASRQKAIARKQDKVMYVCLHVLINLAEDVTVERKMVKKRLVEVGRVGPRSVARSLGRSVARSLGRRRAPSPPPPPSRLLCYRSSSSIVRRS